MYQILQIEDTTESHGHRILRFHILLDDSKVDAKGNPNPAFILILDYNYPKVGMDYDTYVQDCITHMQPSLSATLLDRNNPKPDKNVKWKNHKWS